VLSVFVFSCVSLVDGDELVGEDELSLEENGEAFLVEEDDNMSSLEDEPNLYDDESTSLVEAESDAWPLQWTERHPAPYADSGVSFYTDFHSSGLPKHGPEEWVMQTHGFATNMWGGVVIGNVAAGTKLMIEKFMYHKDKHEEATYGYGFLLSGTEPFGGWIPGTSCGWFALQRDFNSKPTVRAVKAANWPDQKAICPEKDSLNLGHLALTAIQSRLGWIDGHDGLGILKKMRLKMDCPIYLNYDKKQEQFSGKPFAVLPTATDVYRRYTVEAYQVKAALIKTLPGFDRKGWSGWFFIPNKCLTDPPYPATKD